MTTRAEDNVAALDRDAVAQMVDELARVLSAAGIYNAFHPQVARVAEGVVRVNGAGATADTRVAKGDGLPATLAVVSPHDQVGGLDLIVVGEWMPIRVFAQRDGQFIERTAIDLFEDFGYREIRIPIMEKTQLFARSIGEDTDIVEKEMYTFPDRKKDMLTLRPEATASICRSYIQHKMYAQDPVRKFYTIGPMFRRERPQKGRYRQFYQIDAEIFGVAAPYADVELIFLLRTLFDRLNVTDTTAHINSLGCPACRPRFKQALSTLLADAAATPKLKSNRRAR